VFFFNLTLALSSLCRPREIRSGQYKRAGRLESNDAPFMVDFPPGCMCGQPGTLCRCPHLSFHPSTPGPSQPRNPPFHPDSRPFSPRFHSAHPAASSYPPSMLQPNMHPHQQLTNIGSFQVDGYTHRQQQWASQPPFNTSWPQSVEPPAVFTDSTSSTINHSTSSGPAK